MFGDLKYMMLDEKAAWEKLEVRGEGVNKRHKMNEKRRAEPELMSEREQEVLNCRGEVVGLECWGRRRADNTHIITDMLPAEKGVGHKQGGEQEERMEDGGHEKMKNVMRNKKKGMKMKMWCFEAG